jgi:hypothetical protein
LVLAVSTEILRTVIPSYIVQASFQSRDFHIWLVLSAQFLATATDAVPAGLPTWLFQLYRVVSFFKGSSSYVRYEGCGSEYRFVTPLVIFVSMLLLLAAQAAVLHATNRRNALVHVAMLIFAVMNALYSAVVEQCFKFLHCSPAAAGVSFFMGGVATASVEILSNGTTVNQTKFMRYARVMVSPPPFTTFAFSTGISSNGHATGAGLGSTCRWESLRLCC